MNFAYFGTDETYRQVYFSRNTIMKKIIISEEGDVV